MDLGDKNLELILSEYGKTLEIPENKRRPFLLCPVGIVGSGKTTVLKPLAEKLGLVRISSDGIRRILKEKGFNYGRLEEVVEKLARRLIKGGYGVALDADFAKEEKRKKLHETARELNLKVIYIRINPPEEFILNKLKNFKHTWLFENSDKAIANYYARKSLHKNLSIDFVYTFNTSKDDLDKQIEEAYEKIEKVIEQ